MAVPAQAPRPTLTSIRDDLQAQQQKLQEAIDAAKTTQRETEAEQRRIQADFTAVSRIIADQQAAGTAVDDAITQANEVVGNLRPKIEATLDDQVEKQLSDAFDGLIGEGRQAQEDVTDAQGQLGTALAEQATAQGAVDAQEETVKQQRAALSALPGLKNALAKDLKQQQTALEAAFKAGDVRKAYVLLLELTNTRDHLDTVQKPEYEQELVDTYVGGTEELEKRRGELAIKQGEAAKKKTDLDAATARLQKFQAERARRLQEIWTYTY